MSSEDRQAYRREQVVGRMEDAERLLEEPHSSKVKYALSHFTDHVRSGELEKAWDAIADAGDAAAAPPRFWDCLAQAAALLNLEERRAEALRRRR